MILQWQVGMQAYRVFQSVDPTLRFQKELKSLLPPIEKKGQGLPQSKLTQNRLKQHKIEIYKVEESNMELEELEFELNLDQGLEIDTELDLKLDLDLILTGRVKLA